MTSVNPGPATTSASTALQVTYDTNTTTLQAGGLPVVLQKPPFPTHICVVGDSFAQQAGGGKQFTSPQLIAGNAALLNILAGAPWRIDPNLDVFGTPGGTSVTMLASIPNVIARNPQVCILQGSHNDFLIPGPSYYPTVVSNWTQMLTLLSNAGIIPVLCLDPPQNTNQGSSAVTLAQLKQLVLQHNNWKRWYAYQNGYLYWDWNSILQDPASSTGALLAAYTDDNIHPNFAGNMAIAQAGLTQLKSILGPPNTGIVTNQNDQYDATYNYYGNLITSANSPFFLAGGGSLGSGVTGTVPANWNSSTSLGGETGKTIAASLVASNDGIGQWAQFAISGTGTGGVQNEQIWYQLNGIGSTLPPGTIVEGWVQVNVLANSPFTAVLAKIQAGSNTSYGNNVTTPGGGIQGPTVAWSGTIYIPPMVIPASEFTGISMFLQVQLNDTGLNFAGTVQFRRPTIRIVQNPYT